jgi:hypothetical protein
MIAALIVMAAISATAGLVGIECGMDVSMKSVSLAEAVSLSTRQRNRPYDDPASHPISKYAGRKIANRTAWRGSNARKVTER